MKKPRVAALAGKLSLLGALFLLGACGGGNSTVESFDHLQQGVSIGGATPPDHWELYPELFQNSIRLRYANEGLEDFEWLQLVGTNSDKEYFIHITDKSMLSNGALLSGEQHTLDIDLPMDISFPLWFWATYVTVHEVIVHDCNRVLSNGTIEQCDEAPPEPPEEKTENPFFIGY